jgi:hypothetical protein
LAGCSLCGGVFLLAFPDAFISLANRMIGAVGSWQIGYVVMALIGLYLTYVGWMPASVQKADNGHAAANHPPRSA